MFQDLAHSLVALLIFPLFTVIPGYAVAEGFDLLCFRKQRVADQLAISIALSVGCYPALLYLAGHFGAAAGQWSLAAVFCIAASVRAWKNRTVLPGQLAPLLRGLFIAGFVAAFLVISQVDLQWDHILVGSQTEIDYQKHIAVTDALFRTGSDGVNPFFHPSKDVGLFYYHFWHLLCAMVERVAPWITARGAVFGGLPWAAAALAAVIRLYLLFLWRIREARDYGVALLLLLVSGLDIIPVAISDLSYLFGHGGTFYFHLEWWNPAEVTSWLGTMLWVPQHLIGLVANLTAVLLLHWSFENRRRPVISIVLGGLCIASGLGASIWVTLACGLGMAVWGIICAARKGGIGEALMFGAAGGVALLMALPFLIHLRSVAQIKLSPVAFYVRPFGLIDGLFPGRPRLVGLASLVALPLNYAIELGIYGLVAVLWVRDLRRRQWKLEPHEQLAAAFLGSSILLISFVRSTMGNNDLAARGALPAQFFLLILAAQRLQRSPAIPNVTASLRPWAGRVVLACLALGFLTTAYDWLGTRFHHLAAIVAPDQPSYRYQIRAAYEFVKAQTPRTAIIQHNPDRTLIIPYGVYGERQVVASDWFQGPLFAIAPARYADTANDIKRLFARGAAVGVWKEITERYQIAAVIVDETDPIWNDRESWVWNTPPDLAESRVRVYLVGRQSYHFMPDASLRLRPSVR
jgi:hypothetical protein